MSSMEAHIAILPTPGISHLIPTLEFAKRLLYGHRIATTFIIPNHGPLSTAQTAFLAALPPPIEYILLPAVNFDDLPGDVRIETLVSLIIARSLPSIRDAVKSLHERRKLSALVVDLFATDGFEVAIEFSIPRYIFFPSTATALSVFLHLPELDETVSSEYWEVSEKFRLPGCVPIHGRDLVHPLQDRKNDAYKWFLHHAKRYRMAEGIVVNSFKEIEPGPIEALGNRDGNPNVYPVGPLIQTGSKFEPHTCLDWLNNQPTGSILYVSFGSAVTLSHNQIIELALGLEMSEHRFLWVIRCPHNTISNSKDPLAYLPEGFLERTGRNSLVVPTWVPQAEILAHESTGGFLTHCGWNSTLESVVHGVPMIAWPLFAEQRMNAVMLNEEVRVALRLKFGEDGMVGRVEIARAVKDLMEGKEGKGIRSRIRDLQNAAAEAIAENGESVKTLAALAAMWKEDDSPQLP